MSNQLIHSYLRQFGDKYLGKDIFNSYPEAKIIPAYMRKHFSKAEIVLDLGFGAGLWFWASFLPALKRLDGIDAYREAIQEADRVMALDHVPDGYAIAHAHLGESFTMDDLRGLKTKQGRLIIQDYSEPWSAEIRNTRYDLVTEHGGGLGDMPSEDQFTQVIQKSADVLRPFGFMFFVNYLMKERSVLAERLGKHTPPTLPLNMDLYYRAAEQAGMEVIDFHAIHTPTEMPRVETFFYGYAQKQ